jgi:SHS2 domain-containing protein
VNESRIRAILTANAWNDASASDFQEIKAVTYHQLEVCRDGSGWRSSVILDL